MATDCDRMSETSEQEWRAELRRIYDEAYERTHGTKPPRKQGADPDDPRDDPPPGGARVRRKPKLPSGSPGTHATIGS